jgi:uncharacterized membrane protein YidH (DUF202 family)
VLSRYAAAVRRAVLSIAAAVLLLGPTVLAFRSGGYFKEPRLVAAIVAWVLVLVVALVGPRPLPERAPGWAALGGLAFLAAWTALSLTWAPISSAAADSVERVLLYVGALVAAISLSRLPRVARAIEPALAAGVVVVIGYGLAGRLLPGLVEISRSTGSLGRLEQPITYWNAEGALAAMGLVLCARLAGDRTRPAAVRTLAAGACPLLGMGVYLTYSRGAIAAGVVGLVVLLAAAPTRPQLRAVIAAAVSAVVAGGCSALFRGVASLSGSPGAQQRDGALMLALLVLLSGLAALAAARWARAERRERAQAAGLSFARRLPAVAATAVALVVIGLIVGGLGERGESEPERLKKASGVRLTTVESRRYDYWRIGLDAFAREPILGVGAGGYRAEWLRERPVNEGVREVHSLELGFAAELGLPGLLGVLVMLGGVIAAGRRALIGREPIAAGCCAASTVWLLHASIDWDWEMPAVTLPVVVMAGALIAASEARERSPSDGEGTRAPSAVALG